MLRNRLKILVFLHTFSITVLAAEPFPVLEVVELAAADRDALLAAPGRTMNQSPSSQLGEAIRVGIVESIEVDKSTEEFTGKIAAQIGRDKVTTYQGRIRYAPVVLSDSREYRAVVLCVSQDEKITWIHCQDASWNKVQTSGMKKPIRLDGRLRDTVVEEALAYVDQLSLISRRDNSTITANSIHRIVGKGPEGDEGHEDHEGDNTVRLFSRTQVPGYWDAIELSHDIGPDGASIFELEDFRSGQ